MRILGVVAQLRATDLAASIAFYTTKLDMTQAFQYGDFYAGIRAGTQAFHLKLVDDPDPSIPFVEHGGHFHWYFDTPDVDGAGDAIRRNGVALLQDVQDTAWGTREFVVQDNQAHMLYFGQNR